MAKKKSSPKAIKQYEHSDKERLNNPHIGLVNESTDTEYGQNKKTYSYDPHLDPQLVWSGKAERTSFEVPTVSLHVHERIDPKSIIDTVKKEDTSGEQLSFFDQEKKPLREAIEFYKHKEGWTNRLIAGDSLLVMNSLIEKEGMAGKVQTVYFDPPYGISYTSNFQPFVNKKQVKDGNDDDLTQEPEMIKAFRDTWELGIHSYLSYLRDRLTIAKEILSQSGSVFVQISDENLHHVRELLDETFGAENFIANINFVKTSGLQSKLLYGVTDYILWYAKSAKDVKYRQLYSDKIAGEAGAAKYTRIELKDGKRRVLTEEEKEDPNLIPKGARFWVDDNLTSQGNPLIEFEIDGKKYSGTYKTTHAGLTNLLKANRIYQAKDTIRFVRYLDDFPVVPLNNTWTDIGGIQSRSDPKIYVVQTAKKAIQRCILMTSDPGDLVLDITAGSGTTAMVAEEWGRRWITCDTSRIAIALAKQRLLTSTFDFFKYARPEEGISGGFDYRTVPHITLKSIATKQQPADEILYDQPKSNNSVTRVTGPFTVESIPAPFVKSLEDSIAENQEGDASSARSGETLRQDQWRDELMRTGVRAKGGAMMEFTRVEPQEGTKYIQAQAETKSDNPENVLVVFGPEHAPLEARIVALAMDEARLLKPDILLFCAFQFEEEAAKDIDDTPEKLVGFKMLKAHMNMDLQTDDLKKKRSTNESFWLIGQPDVRTLQAEDNKIQIEVAGFDYYDPKTGNIRSGGAKNIAMWMLDSDYDGRSIFPKQIFFPMAGAKDGWAKLAKSLKAEIDEEKIEAFRGTKSLPFEPGKQVAIKIIDDRGIESLKILNP
ncbi:site-specific DNA-methyltransferase [Ekhidna sp.]|uniref:site-specific DNA-methyltransferase n=1 Tax=Ekhidna sp. TaxID=2608089 RepID=UPI00351642B3